MKFRAVSPETRMNYMIWSIQKEIRKENQYLASLPYDPTPILFIVKAHIDRWDPAQLLATDGVEDEYDGESRSITIYITKHLGALEIQGLASEIDRVLNKSFQDLYVQDGQAREVAAQIIAVLDEVIEFEPAEM
ncbi:hypothetical protein [Paenibacillus whitsoniae]|uniref:Uncharacterized protein n=1 Tax=Paenibacillus whitsoniae TaxID=2496558 RepID=A0A430J9F3_9BACL|nr:hypothetical protein [Paenibacillus whitsoniae]RTE07138.1 hypothetical protein EJQ19_21530 [Paenibacillus whitsoniae]